MFFKFYSQTQSHGWSKVKQFWELIGRRTILSRWCWIIVDPEDLKTEILDLWITTMTLFFSWRPWTSFWKKLFLRPEPLHTNLCEILSIEHKTDASVTRNAILSRRNNRIYSLLGSNIYIYDRHIIPIVAVVIIY